MDVGQSDLQGCAGVGARAKAGQTRMTSPDVTRSDTNGSQEMSDLGAGSHIRVAHK